MKKITSILILFALIVTSVFAIDPSSIPGSSVRVTSDVTRTITLKDAIQKEIEENGPNAKSLYELTASIIGSVAADDSVSKERTGIKYEADNKTEQNVLVAPNSSFYVAFKLYQNLTVNTNEEIEINIAATPFTTTAVGEGDSETPAPEMRNCSPQNSNGRTVTWDGNGKVTIKYSRGSYVGENTITYFDFVWPTNPNLRDGSYEATVALTYIIK